MLKTVGTPKQGKFNFIMVSNHYIKNWMEIAVSLLK